MQYNNQKKRGMDVDAVVTITTITDIMSTITAIVKKTLVNVIITTNIITAIVKKTLVNLIITTNTITTAIAKKTLVNVIITTAIAKKTANAKTKKESAIVEIDANVMMTITADAKLTNNHPKKIKRSLILTSFF